MSMFAFGAPPLPQVEEADDNPDIQMLQISENHNQVAAGGAGSLQVAAVGAAAVGAAAVGGAAAGGVGGGAAAQTVNFPKVFYFNDPTYTPARYSYEDFAQEAKIAMTFGGTSFISCGATSNHLRSLISKLHMQYLLMVDTHVAKTKTNEDIYAVNNFLFNTFEDVLHPSRMVMFRIYKNFRDYIFKPVFLATYSTSMTKDIINEPMKMELFNVWLNCTV